MKITKPFTAALLALCLVSPAAFASVVITGTRVIFHAGDETTVPLTNKSDRPALVEAWIDSGNIHSTPDTSTAPFLITPPLFRMEAHTGQTLRVVFTGEKGALPADRESLFWLNVLEVAPQPTGPRAHRAHMQMAVRTRIKLFYRPEGLSVKRSKAAGRLAWRVARHGAPALVVKNPTPYYLTLGGVALTRAGKTYKAQSGMVPPFASLRLPVKGAKGLAGAGGKVRFWSLNDYGAGVEHTAGLTQQPR